MKRIKTRNWGPEFKQVSNLMGLKAVATASNEAALKAEVQAADGSHGFGRHGAQTGWESQLIRAVLQQTPDQAHDPMGLNPTVRQWNGVLSYSHASGAPVFDLFEDYAGAPSHFQTAAGTTAGGFATPEAQFIARARGDQMVNRLSGPNHYCAQFRFQTTDHLVRMPLSGVHVVVEGRAPGSLYGIGFAQRPSFSGRFTRDFVLRMIEGLQKQQTWAELFPRLDATVHKFHHVALRKKRVAFPGIVELADYFDLDVLWQPTCSLIYRRPHLAATNTHGPWRLVTMFPNNLAPGWAPTVYLTPGMKTRLSQHRVNGKKVFNKNKDDYHWTGVTGAAAGRATERFRVPPWA